jgi:hypothetical protein
VLLMRREARQCGRTALVASKRMQSGIPIAEVFAVPATCYFGYTFRFLGQAAALHARNPDASGSEVDRGRSVP